MVIAHFFLISFLLLLLSHGQIRWRARADECDHGRTVHRSEPQNASDGLCGAHLHTEENDKIDIGVPWPSCNIPLRLRSDPISPLSRHNHHLFVCAGSSAVTPRVPDDGRNRDGLARTRSCQGQGPGESNRCQQFHSGTSV